VRPAGPDEREGDIEVDTSASRLIYREWLALTRPGPGPGGLRRPEWLLRPLRPTPDAYRIASEPIEAHPGSDEVPPPVVRA
jgi:hypothetical protein